MKFMRGELSFDPRLINSQCYAEPRADGVEEHFASVRVDVDVGLDAAARSGVEMDSARLGVEVDLGHVLTRRASAL